MLIKKEAIFDSPKNAYVMDNCAHLTQNRDVTARNQQAM